MAKDLKLIIASVIITIIWGVASFSIFFNCFLSCGSFGIVEKVLMLPIGFIIVGGSYLGSGGLYLSMALFVVIVYAILKSVLVILKKFKSKGEGVSVEPMEDIKPRNEMTLKRSLPQFEEPKKEVQSPLTE